MATNTRKLSDFLAEGTGDTFGDLPTENPHIKPGTLYPAVNGILEGDDGYTFTDSSGSARVVTGYEDAHHTTGINKIGTTGIYVGGSSYLKCAHSTDLDFDGEFTIDFWSLQTDYGSAVNNRFFQKGANNAAGYIFASDAATNHKVYFGRTDEQLAGTNFTQDLRDNTWHHFAITRQSDNKFRIYISNCFVFCSIR